MCIQYSGVLIRFLDRWVNVRTTCPIAKMIFFHFTHLPPQCRFVFLFFTNRIDLECKKKKSKLMSCRWKDSNFTVHCYQKNFSVHVTVARNRLYRRTDRRGINIIPPSYVSGSGASGSHGAE